MTTQIIELIGYIAATCTTLAFVPQVWLTWKTRQTGGISLGMYAIFTSGVALWLIYGWMIESWPVVIANILTLLLSLSMLLMKFFFSRRSN
jgi:MtN3 and saliva related transmembrane protein